MATLKRTVSEGGTSRESRRPRQPNPVYQDSIGTPDPSQSDQQYELIFSGSTPPRRSSSPLAPLEYGYQPATHDSEEVAGLDQRVPTPKAAERVYPSIITKTGS